MLHLASAGVAQKLGLESFGGSFTHLSGLAVDAGCWLGLQLGLSAGTPTLCMCPGTLPCMVAGFHGQVSLKERGPLRSCLSFYDLPLKVTHCHSHHILCVRRE